MVGRKRANPTADREAELERDVAEKEARIAELEQRLEAAEKAKEESDRKILDLEQRLEAVETAREESASQGTALRILEREHNQKLDRIAQLEEELSQKEVKIVENEHEMTSSTDSFKTVIGLKNNKIRELETALADAERRAATAAAAAIPATPGSFTDPMTPITIRSIVNGISNISGRVYSNGTIVRDCEWMSFVGKSGDHLEFFVKAQIVAGKNRNLPHAHASFRILSARNCSVLFERNLIGTEKFCNNGWGFSKYIKVEDLLDPKNRYVRMDSILIEVYITEFGVSERH